MVNRIHRYTADRWPDPPPPLPPRLADCNVLVVQVSHLSDRSHTIDVKTPDFARWEPNLGVITFLGHNLSAASRTSDKLSAFAGSELKVVNRGSQRNVFQRQRISHHDIGIGTRNNLVADLKPLWIEDIAFFTVCVMKERNER